MATIPTLLGRYADRLYQSKTLDELKYKTIYNNG